MKKGLKIGLLLLSLLLVAVLYMNVEPEPKYEKRKKTIMIKKTLNETDEEIEARELHQAGYPKGIQIIEVYIYEDLSENERVKKYIGDVLIDSEGEMIVSILNEGDAASRLRVAIEDISSRGSLMLRGETMINGNLVMYGKNVSSTDEGYLWPVASILKKEYFFNTKVVYVK